MRAQLDQCALLEMRLCAAAQAADAASQQHAADQSAIAALTSELSEAQTAAAAERAALNALLSQLRATVAHLQSELDATIVARDEAAGSYGDARSNQSH